MGMDETTLVQQVNERWRNLTIADDFVFGKVMQNPDVCKDVLEAILGTPIDHIDYIGRQDDLDVSPFGHGVRLDVYVRDGLGTVYIVEMQATNTHELPQRARYYHSMLTFSQLERGERYRALKDSYVIFICGFDLFGLGRRVYSFQSQCVDDPDLSLHDGLHTIFLAASSPAEPDEGRQINELLDYVSTGKVTGTLSSKLDHAVSQVMENKEWRLEFMMQVIKDQLNVDKGHELGLKEGLELGRQKGLEEGRQIGEAEGKKAGLEEGRQIGTAEGRETGIAEGEDRLARLVSQLDKDGRSKDIILAAKDKEARNRLYAEYGIS